jgi:hypothetical protein
MIILVLYLKQKMFSLPFLLESIKVIMRSIASVAIYISIITLRLRSENSSKVPQIKWICMRYCPDVGSICGWYILQVNSKMLIWYFKIVYEELELKEQHSTCLIIDFNMICKISSRTIFVLRFPLMLKMSVLIYQVFLVTNQYC